MKTANQEQTANRRASSEGETKSSQGFRAFHALLPVAIACVFSVTGAFAQTPQQTQQVKTAVEGQPATAQSESSYTANHVQPGQLASDQEPVPSASADTPTQLNSNYEPITNGGRLVWFAKASFGPTSIFAGVIVAGYQTAFKHPPEWGSGWTGFGDRFALRTADVALSNGIQASLGAVWGEDPRYFRQGEGSFGSRLGHAAYGVFMDRFHGGEYRPAIARYAGIAGGNFINNYWHPAGMTSLTDEEERVGTGFASKFASNVFKEFWPDVKNHVLPHHSH
jgi:hypothetical protein